jgi:hypothetical protein
MFGGALGDLLPLAIGIAISPVPIIACILMLFSARAAVNGPAFAVGWVLGVAAATTIVMRLAGAAAPSEEAGGPTLADVAILVLGVLAILLGFRQWRGRPRPGEDAPLPVWMAAIDSFTPVRAFGIAALLSAVNPKNLALAAAAGVVISAAVEAGGSAVAMIVVFDLIASASILVPVVYYLVGGEGAKRAMDGWRTWLASHNAAVMAVLLVVIGAKLVGSGLDGLLA